MGEGRGVEGSKIELVENKIIWSKFTLLFLRPPQSKQTVYVYSL